MYKIAFVDESKTEIRRFQRYMHADNIEVFDVLPLENLEDCVEELLSRHFDAIVSDFQLNDYKEDIVYNVAYTGTELIQAILKKKKGFPCFVITSFDQDAIKSIDDVNIVYAKSMISKGSDSEEVTLRERILTQVDHYKTKLENVRQEVMYLGKKQDITEIEQERLIELDSFIEESSNMDRAMPPHIKRQQHLDELYKLIDNTDELLKEYKEMNK